MTKTAIAGIDKQIADIQKQLSQLAGQKDVVTLQRELNGLIQTKAELEAMEHQAQAEKEVKELLEKRAFNRKKLKPVLEKFVADYNRLLSTLRGDIAGWLELDRNDCEQLNLLQANSIPPMPLFRSSLPQEIALTEDELYALLAIGRKVGEGDRYQPAPMPQVGNSRPFVQPNFMPSEVEVPGAGTQVRRPHPANVRPWFSTPEVTIEFPAKALPAQATDGKGG